MVTYYTTSPSITRAIIIKLMMTEQYSLRTIRKLSKHYTNLRKEVLRDEQKQSNQTKTKIQANNS